MKRIWTFRMILATVIAAAALSGPFAATANAAVSFGPFGLCQLHAYGPGSTYSGHLVQGRGAVDGCDTSVQVKVCVQALVTGGWSASFDCNGTNRFPAYFQNTGMQVSPFTLAVCGRWYRTAVRGWASINGAGWTATAHSSVTWEGCTIGV